MIKFILTVVLSLVGLFVSAKDANGKDVSTGFSGFCENFKDGKCLDGDGSKGPENSPGYAGFCQNFKDGKCFDAEGINSNCCITHAIGTGNSTTASQQAADKTTPGEGASSSGDTAAPAVDAPKAK
jgi:hypothetical protein